ncbi:hypothetical protein K469DRAFT_721609 [Zopfia rhizophila CBS 207.26]|uniref:U6 snRNA-associated Sm-like protein LSm1 n=1 Tax=Zopfia rhizophila CBS 207.26 TaxID=1314779 RepID=A0A6A6EI03_9PEZI|nr:hypothetical protein K469DRAFT_721609 [Zopfia rhizophila CBS 207.26]
MLARSLQQPQEESTPEPVGAASQSINYGGVYQAAPGPPQYDPNALGTAAPAPQPPVFAGPADLPPQAFLTSAMLMQLSDKKINVILRDDKGFVGILRSYDQFGNMVLTETVERIFARNPDFGKDPAAPRWLFCDIPIGVITIRGENVAVAGSVDLDKEDDMMGCVRTPEELVRKLAREEKAVKKTESRRKAKILRNAGIEPGFGMEG